MFKIKTKTQFVCLSILVVLLICLLIYLGIILYKYISAPTEKYSGFKNIYGQPLKSCRGNTNPTDRNGSWDDSGFCSDRGANDVGVHQICIKEIGEGIDFSDKTGQTSWSPKRKTNSHCACLGAWANFVAKMKKEGNTNDKVLDCEAIPESALSKKYVGKWKNWNDVTIKNQIDDGLDELERQCTVRDETKQSYLDNLLSNLRYAK